MYICIYYVCVVDIYIYIYIYIHRFQGYPNANSVECLVLTLCMHDRNRNDMIYPCVLVVCDVLQETGFTAHSASWGVCFVLRAHGVPASSRARAPVPVRGR